MNIPRITEGSYKHYEYKDVLVVVDYWPYCIGDPWVANEGGMLWRITAKSEQDLDRLVKEHIDQL